MHVALLKQKENIPVFLQQAFIESSVFVGLPGRCSTPTAALQFVKAWGGQKKSISMKIKQFSVVGTTLGCIEKPCKEWDKRPTSTVEQDFNKNREFPNDPSSLKRRSSSCSELFLTDCSALAERTWKTLEQWKNPGWLGYISYIGDYTT